MVQESVLVDNPIKEVEELIKKLIPSVKGKIIEISNGGNLIHWTYKYGLQIIECETHLIPHQKQTEITTYSQSDDIWETGSKQIINKFYTSLFQGTNMKVPKITQKANPKPHIKNNIQTQNINLQKEFNYKPILFGIAILFFLYFIGNNNNDTSTTSRTTAQGFKASYNEESLHNLVKYSVSKDYESIETLLNNGEVFELPAGQEAYIIESKLGRVKIRLKGETKEIWTFSEAIKSE